MCWRSLLLSAVVGCTGLCAEMAAAMVSSPAMAQSRTTLKLRHLGDRVDLMISGLGDNPRVISQRGSSSRWIGRLRGSALVDGISPQSVAMPSLGLASIELKAATDSTFELLVQATQGMALPEPAMHGGIQLACVISTVAHSHHGGPQRALGSDSAGACSAACGHPAGSRPGLSAALGTSPLVRCCSTTAAMCKPGPQSL